MLTTRSTIPEQKEIYLKPLFEDHVGDGKFDEFFEAVYKNVLIKNTHNDQLTNDLRDLGYSSKNRIAFLKYLINEKKPDEKFCEVVCEILDEKGSRFATFFRGSGDSLDEKSVNLHRKLLCAKVMVYLLESEQSIELDAYNFFVKSKEHLKNYILSLPASQDEEAIRLIDLALDKTTRLGKFFFKSRSALSFLSAFKASAKKGCLDELFKNKEERLKKNPTLNSKREDSLLTIPAPTRVNVSESGIELRVK